MVSFRLEQFDSYRCPRTGRTSRGFHVDLWSCAAALTKPRGNDLMKDLSRRLCGEEGFKGGAAGSRYRYDLLPAHRGGDMPSPPPPPPPQGGGELEPGGEGGGSKDEAAAASRSTKHPRIESESEA